MLLVTDKTTKTVELPTGKKMVRTATYSLSVPTSNEEGDAILGENLYKWAAFGMKKHVMQLTANKLMGGGMGDRKLMRQFNEGLRTLEDIMSMSKEAALESLFAHPKFAAVKEYYDSVGAGEDLVLDFTTGEGVPLPASFDGAEDEPEADDAAA